MALFDLPSIHSLASFAGGLLSQIPLFANTPSQTYTPYSDAPNCPSDSPLSCHNSTSAPDSCCFIYPGGQLLSTQFWDTSPSIGPIDSWTLHGLWFVLPLPCILIQSQYNDRPDLCDGTYPTYCTSAPQYHNITAIISAAQPELLDYMNEYWLPNSGTTEKFWQHEWNKHGTCVNTLAPSCYGEEYEAGDEVVDFMGKAVEVFKVSPFLFHLTTLFADIKAGIGYV